MNLSFEKLDRISTWTAQTEEVRYCPLAEEEFKVAEHRWPSYYMNSGRFTFFVN